MMLFPTVSGTNLEGQQYHLPGDFAGAYNVVLIAFQQWQQMEVNTWVPFVKGLVKHYPTVNYYELPTIWKMSRLQQKFIDMGMRLGIPDRSARQATITLYLDKQAFRQALELRSEDEIHVLLVTPAGEVLWRTGGSFSAEKGDSLSAALTAAIQRDLNDEGIAS
jgi:hypothetical protein